MKGKPTLFIIAAVLIIIFAVILVSTNKKDAKWESPFSGITQRTSPTQTPIPSPTPKTFNFDSSTDLKQELETINPQVLDSDFE